MLVSIMAVYGYDNTVFDDMVVPISPEEGKPGMDKQLLVRLLLRELAELSLVYSDPTVLKQFIADWSESKLNVWQRLWNLAYEDYSPLENYNRHEENSFTHGHNITDTYNKTDTDIGSVNQSVYGFNSEDPANKDSASHNSAYAQTGTIGRANTGTDRENKHQYGNIGVTTSQQMAEQELALRPKLDIYKYIIEDFKQEFCVIIY